MIGRLNAWERFIMFPFVRRQRVAARTRSCQSRSEFVAYFPPFEPEAGAVWDSIQPFIFVDNFSPYPDDGLYRMFTLTAEELDDVGLEALGALGYPLPAPADRRRWPNVVTVRDLVEFLARCRPGMP